MSEAKTCCYLWLFWCLAFVGVTVDLASKYTIFHVLYDETNGYFPGTPPDEIAVVPGVFELSVQYYRLPNGTIAPHVNQGALFGLGQGTAGSNTLFAVISILAAGAIVFWCTRRSTRADRLLCASLGLILGGTLGNLYDRIVFGGVRDFLHVHWHVAFDWPVFNIADSCLVCGAGLLLLHAFFMQPATKECAPAAPEAQQIVNAQ